jgi:hypothetical protein
MPTIEEKLQALIAANPDILSGPAGAGDVKEAAAALSRLAKAKGVDLVAADIETAFQTREAAAQPVEALDDDALAQVAGGGSPWCMFTKGCYCFFTK